MNLPFFPFPSLYRTANVRCASLVWPCSPSSNFESPCRDPQFPLPPPTIPRQRIPPPGPDFSPSSTCPPLTPSWWCYPPPWASTGAWTLFLGLPHCLIHGISSPPCSTAASWASYWSSPINTLHCIEWPASNGLTAPSSVAFKCRPRTKSPALQPSHRRSFVLRQSRPTPRHRTAPTMCCTKCRLCGII